MQSRDSKSRWLGVAVAVPSRRRGSSGYSWWHPYAVSDIQGVPGVLPVEAGVALVVGQLAVGEGPGTLLQTAGALVPHQMVPRVHAAVFS